MPLNVGASARLGVVILVTLAVANDPVTVCAQSNPSWLGRPLVKVIVEGDPIPGAAGATFNEISSFTLRDGVLHIVAGEGANKKGLFRWHDGTLSKLVYTDTMAPTGSPFDTVHFTTDETEGALNFVGEVFFGRPGFVYGLFEWRDGVIRGVLDSAAPVGGKTLNGFGYPVRVGHEVVGSSQFLEDGVLKNGILRWDGTTLHTVIQSGDDLPGSLGAFTGQPGRFQIAFDGQTVAFVASDNERGQGPTGVYRAGPDRVITKVIDGNDRHPSNKTYFQRGARFPNVDVVGDATYFSTTQWVSAAGPDSFYLPGARQTGGTFNVATGIFGTDVQPEVFLPGRAADGVTPITLDGVEWTAIELVDGQGDDVAFTVRLANNKLALYAAVGSATTPPKAPVLSAAALSGGKVMLRFASLAGVTYRIEFQSALDRTGWTSRGDLVGTGNALEFNETAVATGFYRVTVLP